MNRIITTIGANSIVIFFVSLVLYLFGVPYAFEATLGSFTLFAISLIVGVNHRMLKQKKELNIYKDDYAFEITGTKVLLINNVSKDKETDKILN